MLQGNGLHSVLDLPQCQDDDPKLLNDPKYFRKIQFYRQHIIIDLSVQKQRKRFGDQE